MPLTLTEKLDRRKPKTGEKTAAKPATGGIRGVDTVRCADAEGATLKASRFRKSVRRVHCAQRPYNRRLCTAAPTRRAGDVDL